jgi:hypothetical protein
VSEANVVVDGHPETEKFDPAVPIIGAVTSFTVIVCATVTLVLPQPSVALHVLVKVIEQLVPELTSETTVGVTTP